MTRKVARFIKLGFLALSVCLITLWGVRAYNAWKAPPLQLWHTYIPKELSIAEMDAADWGQYLKREEALFASVRANVTEKLPPNVQVQSNRYFSGARIYPPNFASNWNRSYVLEPEGKVKGAAVFLHGLTDAPYSLRHLARRYRDDGFVAIGLRIPAHGTVPGALSDVTWEEWMAGTRLAVREAKSRIDPSMPLHIVGFSNGGALAVKYALDALENPSMPKPDRLILLSPMVGITRFARFAGLAAVPAFLPAFAKAAWLGVMPEFNPFKYNSFPVNGARQSHRLTVALQEQITRLSRTEAFEKLPPILTFQSVMDYTVSTSAIIYALYSQLPANGSELVLFDVNRASIFGPLMSSASEIALTRLLPAFPQHYSLTVVKNIAVYDVNTEARTTKAGETEVSVKPLGLEYPPHIYSLSHVAIPFPMDDPLYGMAAPPEAAEKFGVNLGGLSARGERGALIVNPGTLTRTSSNPFFPYLFERVEAWITDPLPRGGVVKGMKKNMPPPASYEQDVKAFLDESQDEAGAFWSTVQ